MDFLKDVPDDLKLKDLDPGALQAAGLQISAMTGSFSAPSENTDPDEFVLTVLSTENKKLNDHLTQFQVLGKEQTGRYAISLLEMLSAADHCIKQAKVKDQQGYKTVFTAGFKKSDGKGVFFKFSRYLGELRSENSMQLLASGLMENMIKGLAVRKSLSMMTVGDFRQNLAKRENFLSGLANLLNQPLAQRLHEGCQKKYRVSLKQGLGDFLKQEDVSALDKDNALLVKSNQELVLDAFSEDVFSFCTLSNGEEALLVRGGADLQEVLEVCRDEDIKLEFYDSERAFIDGDCLSEERLDRMSQCPEDEQRLTDPVMPDNRIKAALKVLSEEFPDQRFVPVKSPDGNGFSIAYVDPGFNAGLLDRLRNEGRIDTALKVGFNYAVTEREVHLADAQGRKLNLDERGDCFYYIGSGRSEDRLLNDFLNQEHAERGRDYAVYPLGMAYAVKLPYRLFRCEDPSVRSRTEKLIETGMITKTLGDVFRRNFISASDSQKLISEIAEKNQGKRGVKR